MNDDASRGRAPGGHRLSPGSRPFVRVVSVEPVVGSERKGSLSRTRNRPAGSVTRGQDPSPLPRPRTRRRAGQPFARSLRRRKSVRQS